MAPAGQARSLQRRPGCRLTACTTRPGSTRPGRVVRPLNSVPAMNVTVVSVSPKTSAKGTSFFVGLLEGHGLIKGFAKATVAIGDVVTARISDTKEGFAAFVGY